MSDFEVVRSDVDGWDVRRVGEAQALSNYATKELAEEAAQKQQDAEEQSGAGSQTIDIRQDVFSEGPEEDLDAKKTLLGAGTILIGVIVLIAVIGLIVALTSFGT
jgi:uncharacterized protein DUF2188